MDRDPRGPRAESLGGRSAVVYRRHAYTTALAQRRAELAGGGGGDVYLHPEVLFFLGRRGGRTRGASPAPARTTHGARDAFLPTRDFERSTARGRREEDWDGRVRGAAPSPATARKGVARCRRRAQDSRARRAGTSWSARVRHREPPRMTATLRSVRHSQPWRTHSGRARGLALTGRREPVPRHTVRPHLSRLSARVSGARC